MLRNTSLFLLITAVSILTITCKKDTIKQDPLTVDLSYEVSSLSVIFNSVSTNAVSYYWEFGDGETSPETNPVHGYKVSGKYNVKLTVTGMGNTAIKAVELFVSDPTIVAGIPVNPNATADTRKVMNYLYNLNRTGFSGGVIVGQTVVSAYYNFENQYSNNIDGLFNLTNKYPGFLAVEYTDGNTPTVNQLKAANIKIKDYWIKGGLIDVGWTAANPFGSSHSWTDYEVTVAGSIDLKDILPGGVKRELWVTYMDIIASGLQDLQDAGVVVLFRPLQEMNRYTSGSFWWAKFAVGGVTPAYSHDSYKKLWIDLYNYFTYTKKLNNLLWVFSPMVNAGWSSFPYPGDAYVDIVAGTYYSDQHIDQYNMTKFPGYNDFLTYTKKGIGQAECGPRFGPGGTYDDRDYLNEVEKYFPKLPWFLVWSNWTGVKLAIVDHKYPNEFMNDPRAICRGDSRLNWRAVK